MKVSQLPPALLPREKLLIYGAEALSNVELLAIFLRTGSKGMSVLELSHQVLSDGGSLRTLLNASEEEFCRHKGLGRAKYAELMAIKELLRRTLAESVDIGEDLSSAESVKKYLTYLLRDKRREVFYVFYLNTQFKLIEEEALFEGTLDSAQVYPREVVKRALAVHASAIILAHNHPSGVAEPSQSDRRLTQRLSDALALVDIRILDHFVVGESEVVSFAQRGWI
ncbi:RadC family protein [Vibrio sonorensis]|uniref:RadC family protein n=1 Tax=Vibrio sonorensis TaxID=1004316 RepID=UPI0008D942B1|nr:DNA repair protein RadC [Vibrio sonorensis]